MLKRKKSKPPLGPVEFVAKPPLPMKLFDKFAKLIAETQIAGHEIYLLSKPAKPND